MKRLLILSVVALVITGCQSQQPPPTANPFVGPTRVPPPGTNTYSNDMYNPYYPGAPPSLAPQSVIPQATPNGLQPGTPSGSQNYAPPSSQNYAPPGGSFNYGGSSAPGYSSPIPTPARSASSTPSARSTEIPATVDPPRVLGGIQRVEIPSTALVSTPPPPRLLGDSGDAIDITDLPEPGVSAASEGTTSKSNSSGFRLISGVEDRDESANIKPAVGSSPVAADPPAVAGSSPQTLYGRAPDYGWVRGQLEYSQIDRHWKLRYIPLGEKTDAFGGSVVICDPSALSGLERGDFVQVQGRVAENAPKNGFSPAYEVAKIEQLGRTTP